MLPAAFATAGGAPTRAYTNAHAGEKAVRAVGLLAEEPPEGGAGAIAGALAKPKYQ